MNASPVEAPVIVARTAGPEGSRAIGAALSRLLRPGDVVLLSGDLGAGKTVLAQGIAAGLGVTDPVTSPTFTLVRPLPCGPGAGDPAGPAPVRTMLHADLYRLDHLREVVDLGLGELVEDDAVAVVEWGDAAEPVLGRDALGIRLEPLDDGAGDAGDARKLTFTLAGEWTGRAGALAKCVAPWVTVPGRASGAAR
jgi:tRNA threonylcarbamoyladenosine biosynthesis protein TsaE